MIITVTFEFIHDIWHRELWPDRQSAIESHSAMLLDRTYDLKNFEYPASYFVSIVDNKVAGCNSGHMCCDGSYRSRGLFVFPEYRKQGVGTELLIKTIAQGQQEGAHLTWSYPRFESWKTYKKAGFALSSEWEVSETGLNAYCTLKY